MADKAFIKLIEPGFRETGSEFSGIIGSYSVVGETYIIGKYTIPIMNIASIYIAENPTTNNPNVLIFS